MGFTYYDHLSGQPRMKRRYVWAGMGFLAGIIVGACFGLIA